MKLTQRLLYLAPLAGRGRRALARRVRGPLRESEPVERPPHPDPLHSPSTGVNALMASGEREQSIARRNDSISSERGLGIGVVGRLVQVEVEEPGCFQGGHGHDKQRQQPAEPD
jgi:hypothetical protein